MLRGAGCHGHALGREKEESSLFNEIAVKLEELLTFFSPYFIISLIFYQKMIGMCFSASPRSPNTVYMCTRVYFCTNPGKVLHFKVHRGKIWHKYPHVIHLSLCVTTIYCLNYFADGLR